MKFSIRAFLVLFLFVTIGWKLSVRPIELNNRRDVIAAFLERNRLKIPATQPEILQIPIAVAAHSTACKYLIGVTSPYGFNIEFFQHRASVEDRMFFVFRGRVYDHQPVLLTSITYLVYRFLHDLGLSSGIPPVLAVLSSCDAEQLPWSELQF